MQTGYYGNQCAHSKRTDHSQTVGRKGPVLMQDGILHETLADFVNEKIVERAVHTKGYGAFGTFKTLRSMKEYTTLCFLQKPGQKTSALSRFSLAVSKKGTPDTSRNVRGFSTKFYTEEGNFDLLCNHLPVFLVRDAMEFPKAIRALSPSPVNNLMDPAAFWCFAAENPEATHFLTLLYSDLGTVDNFRCLRYYGVNTYVWINAKGERRLVKYHWKPKKASPAPMESKPRRVRTGNTKKRHVSPPPPPKACPAITKGVLDRQEAGRVAGERPDIAGQDLYDTIGKGKTVEFELYVQLMTSEEAESLAFDPLDDTKVWDEEQFPLLLAGCLTLDRNPDNYFEQVEKVCFSPANLLPGAELSNDKMLQGRSFVYWDAQRRRIGPEFRDVLVNRAKNFAPTRIVSSGDGETVAGKIVRREIRRADNFTQAGAYYRSLCDDEQENLAGNIASELYVIPEAVQKCVLAYLYNADPSLGDRTIDRMRRYQNPLD